jgi:hypothetical protein
MARSTVAMAVGALSRSLSAPCSFSFFSKSQRGSEVVGLINLCSVAMIGTASVENSTNKYEGKYYYFVVLRCTVWKYSK